MPTAWLATCSSGCDTPGNWSETHIAGPFDLTRAPYASGFFLGDYEGLAGTTSGFGLLDSIAGAPGSTNSVDTSFVSVMLP